MAGKPGRRPGSGAEGAAKGGRWPPGGASLRIWPQAIFFFNNPRGGMGGFFKKIVKLTTSCVRMFCFQEMPSVHLLSTIHTQLKEC